MPVANALHDVLDRLAAASCDHGVRSAPAAVASASETGGPGWPVEPADLFVLDPRRSVAVSTLGDPELARALAATAHPALALAAPTATENIGVEKLVRNVLADPALRVLVVAGPETGGTAPTGHYAGDALVKLCGEGVDPATMRIRGARGRRPVLTNLSPAAVEAFRRHVTVVDLRGECDVATILTAVAAALACLPAAPPEWAADPAASAPSGAGAVVAATDLAGRTPYRPDPAGYVLVFADRVIGCLVLEHYTNRHERTVMLAGADPADLCLTAVRRGLVGTLEHAAYLGRELQRAADALASGAPYVQE